MKRYLYNINYTDWTITPVTWTSFREDSPGYHETEREATKALSLWLNGRMYAMHLRWVELQIVIADGVE